jgi:hypothetical protein
MAKLIDSTALESEDPGLLLLFWHPAIIAIKTGIISVLKFIIVLEKFERNSQAIQL